MGERQPNLIFTLSGKAIIFNFRSSLLMHRNMHMRKIRSASIMLLICLAWLGLAASQGMGTPAYGTDQPVMVMPDYISPYDSAMPQGYQGSANPVRLMMEPADPDGEGLLFEENKSQANQLYIQMGNRILTEGTAMLGEEYVLWARIRARGDLQLFDYNGLLFSQPSVQPGWYRISGAYGDFLGGHLYRFQVAGLSSNDLAVTISSGSYPTAYSLVGRVVDESGNGLSGAGVTLTNSDGGRFSTSTDDGGYYGLDVAAGLYAVNAQHPGYSFAPSQVQVVGEAVSAARPLVGLSMSVP
ncbi:MAG TPA: carboxypeptidase-like regulatory domain-containing protein [Methanothrix sp.]|nr:carboxypeptidase-like regulatory domain-containing protein [Methanothrix sp.]